MQQMLLLQLQTLYFYVLPWSRLSRQPHYEEQVQDDVEAD